MRRKLAAGNWKMQGMTAQIPELEAIGTGAGDSRAEVLIAPPATLLSTITDIGLPIALGGQDCHAKQAGAHTGDISAEMLKDAGADYVILGHSERRTDYGETSEDVCDKVLAAWGAGLTAVVCVGETLRQREAKHTLDVIAAQLALSVPDGATAENLVIAYEPVWAIGTGLVPNMQQIGEVHDFMRDKLAARFGPPTANGIRLLYGGSVKPGNAAEIFAVSNVDGALVGGASLKATDFLPIIDALNT